MAERSNLISMLIMIQFTLLIVEFLVGMYLNLFPQINFPLSMGSGFSSVMLSLAPHMAIGILLFVIGLVIVIISVRGKDQRIRTSSILALLFIILAGVAGYMFAFQSGSDLMSFSMATGFVLALIIYMIPVSVLMRSTGQVA
ncbi:hypothetical protein IX51_04725 [uncultured archaeon]|nr:hypothetical protein IX51_04725 [uncultured archaeon]